MPRSGIFAFFKVHYQLDGVVVRASGDEYLIDHFLDQEQAPAPQRLHLLQLGLSLVTLQKMAPRTKTPLDNVHHRATGCVKRSG